MTSVFIREKCFIREILEQTKENKMQKIGYIGVAMEAGLE
jgi:hypothetical protein